MRQNIPRHCSVCGEEVQRTVVQYENDEIALITCTKEGLYAVVGMDGSLAVASNSTPETTEHVSVTTEFGDEIVLAANVRDGFYTTSQSEVETLVGEEPSQSS